MTKNKTKDCPDCGTQHGSKNECPAPGSANKTSLLIPMVVVSAVVAFYMVNKKKNKAIEDKAVAMGADQSFEPVSFGLS